MQSGAMPACFSLALGVSPLQTSDQGPIGGRHLDFVEFEHMMIVDDPTLIEDLQHLLDFGEPLAVQFGDLNDACHLSLLRQTLRIR